MSTPLLEKIYKKIYIPERRFLLDGKARLSDVLQTLLIIRKGIYDFIDENKSYVTGRVLDLGCGEKPYISLFDYDEYIGVDVEKSGHTEERHAFVDVYYDGNTLPFDDEYFDAVIFSQVMEHIYNIDRILDEISRVMKKNAKIIITVPLMEPEHEIPYDFFRYTSFALEKKLIEHGIELIYIKKLQSEKNVIRQLKINYGVHRWIKKGSVWSALSAFAILITNNTAFLLDKQKYDQGECFMDIGVVARKK